MCPGGDPCCTSLVITSYSIHYTKLYEIDEKGTAEFTIQEVVDRSGQSLRSFYQYFEGKEELLFALLEESIGEALSDLREAVESETEPLARLRAFTIRLHEWCEPIGAKRKRGSHDRAPLSEFSLQLALIV